VTYLALCSTLKDSEQSRPAHWRMTHRILTPVITTAVVMVLQAAGEAQSPLPIQGSSMLRNIEAQNVLQPPGDHNYLSEQIKRQKQGTSSGSQPGIITGTIVDQMGAVSTGASIRLMRDGKVVQDAPSGSNGQFSFSHVDPGSFQLTITSAGFATHTFSGELRPGETFIVPAIVMTVASAVTEVRVGLSPVEVAQAQVKEQEKQRVLGFIPNFYVSYEPNAVPLTPRLKFQLAWRSSIDPVTFLGVATLAGIAHGTNDLDGYGQGAQGYAKRFGALYADDFIGTFIGSAMLPSVLKQDPRYFYRGKGSVASRLGYALANAVICKGDNGKWQPNYSGVLGSLATGGISYLYYPPGERQGAGLFFTNALIKAGENSVAGVFQEFVIPRFTPHLRHNKTKALSKAGNAITTPAVVDER
jgi:Carboxypeptidase regulatory-like domain